jgi:ATP-dependent Lon protease
VDEVLAIALAEPLVAIDWTEADELAAQPPQLPNSPAEPIRH